MGWKFSPHFPTIIAGVAVIAFGILWPWVVKIPLFRLPEDIVVTEPHLRVYVLMASMVGLSVVISLLLWMIRRLTQQPGRPMTSRPARQGGYLSRNTERHGKPLIGG